MFCFTCTSQSTELLYLSWLQPLDGPPSEEPLCEQEEQEDLRVLGCHMGGRPGPGVSIRSWGTVRGQREEHQLLSGTVLGSGEPQDDNGEESLISSAASHALPKEPPATREDPHR